MSEVNVVEVKPLQKTLQRFNEDLGQFINADQRYKLGRVLTIIDAAIADNEQRKAIKDLIQNEWWTSSIRPAESPMENPHTDLRGICIALGFELYEHNTLSQPQERSSEDFAASRYKKVMNEQ